MNLYAHLSELPATEAIAFRALVTRLHTLPQREPSPLLTSRILAAVAAERAHPTPTCNQKPETRNQKPETRNQKPETRNQKPETRNQKPETRNQKPETRNQKPETQNSGIGLPPVSRPVCWPY